MLLAREKDGVRILSFPEETTVDAENAHRLFAEALKLAGDARACVLDLAKLGFIDSAGLRGLIGLRRALHQKGGGLALARPRDDVREILEVTRLTKILPTYPDLTSAVRALKEQYLVPQDVPACAPRFKITEGANGYILRVEGCDSVDRTNVTGILRAVARLASRGKPVVVDLREVDYVDSAALTYLMQARRKSTEVGAELYLLVTPALAELILAQAPDWRRNIVTEDGVAERLVSRHDRPQQVDATPEQPKVQFVDLGLFADEKVRKPR